MKKFLVSTTIVLIGFFASAGNPPGNYPAVNGIVKKIDLAGKEITLKHETIPNLNMPGMTMPFNVEDVQILNGIQIGDQIRFSATENSSGDLIIIWIEKSQLTPITELSPILCTGLANTTPKTNIAVEIRHDKFSTIRYEFAEGPYKGTAYINSIGNMNLKKVGSHFYYQAGDGKLDSKLSFEKTGTEIQNAKFYSYNAHMNFEPVHCEYQN